MHYDENKTKFKMGLKAQFKLIKRHSLYRLLKSGGYENSVVFAIFAKAPKLRVSVS